MGLPALGQELSKFLVKSAMFCLLAFTIVAGGQSQAHAGDLYAMVVGIDDYVGKDNDLDGAVNDANDIYSALQRAGARKIERFLNKEAIKDNIKEAWYGLVGRAKAGDTIIFTFAGHGSQEDEPPGRSGEKDGKNENFLLAGFEPSGLKSRERIVDDELFVWMKAADDRGIRVVLVADSCHSGTMHRAISSKRVKYRQGRFSSISGDRLNYPSASAALLTEDDLKHTTFIGATTDDRLTPEITIDGRYRGALSWSFARALEGVADKNRDGFVSQLELLSYIIPAVKAHVENQQSPQISPLRAMSLPLFPVAKNTGKADRPDLSQEVQTVVDHRLKVAVEQGRSGNLSLMPGIEIVDDSEKADVIWNVTKGTVTHRVGGLVAQGVNEDSVVYVLNKWSAIKFLKSRMLDNPVKMSLPRGDHRYKRNEIIELEISGVRYPYITLFNLPPDGKVEFFMPRRANEAQKDWRRSSYRNKFRVSQPPYGAEHIVVIFSNDVLNGFHAALSRMGRPRSAAALGELLKETLSDKDVQVGVLGVYTSG